MTADEYHRDHLAIDAARAIMDGAERYAKGRDGAAIEDAARVISCYAFGHPSQPTWFLCRFEQRPWRCARCHTWWITKYEYDCFDAAEWRWHRVQEVGDDR